jgi:single-strand DNA-binding protein
MVPRAERNSTPAKARRSRQNDRQKDFIMSFKMFAVGNLAAAPELGEKGECRFSLISNDYAGPDKPKIVTQLWLVAFGATAQAIAKHCLVGDQLIVSAHLVANNYLKDGETVYRYSNIVDSFEFGQSGREKRALAGAA